MMENFKEKLEEYLIDIDIAGYSKKTIQNRRSTLKLFPKWLIENKLHPVSDDDYLKCFKQFLYSKKNNGASKNYINLLTITQKQFNLFCGYKWLDNMPLPKRDRPLPKIVSSDEYSRLISVLENRECKSEYCVKVTARNTFILKLLYHTGLRVSELTNLCKSDFNTTEKTIKVIGGKGDKSRIVLFNDEVLEAYHKYNAIIGGINEDEYLIVNFAYGEIKHNKITTKSIANIIDNTAKLAGIERKLSPHQFRHAYATNLVKAGMNIRAVQMLMGHSSLETTQIYVNLTLEDIRNEYAKL